MNSRIRTRTAAHPARDVRVARDPDVMAAYLEDAAHFPGGHAVAVAFPENEAEVAEVLRRSRTVLPVGAQSSLTGGATPMGDTVLSLARLDRSVRVSGERAIVPPAVTLAELQQALAPHGRWYPPAPTYDGATVGGSVATNAAGAATFKYGATRAWVDGFTMVLASGEILDVRRGETCADEAGCFQVEQSDGMRPVPVPRYRMPSVPKCSAGYFAAPAMDLADLFIGAEGTLGVITSVTVRTAPTPPATCEALIWCGDEPTGLALVASLRDASHRTWRDRDPRGIDVAAIEHLDRRSLALLREDGIDRREDVAIPPGAAMALLVRLELPAGTSAAQCYEELGAMADGRAPDTPLVRAARAIERAGLLGRTELALPGDAARARRFAALREAVPEAVNRRVGLAKQQVDARIEKVAADMIVPHERFADSLAGYRAAFGRRGLDVAIWGHISDGNVHPNVIPRAYDDVLAGKEAVMACGRLVIAMGGSPLAEHGVGRSRIKQQLLALLYGEEGLEQMRAVKRALDPAWKLSPGVILPR